MSWDPVKATRDLNKIPIKYLPECKRIEEALKSYEKRCGDVILRQVYSLQSALEIIDDGESRSLVWDWRWVEHVRRILAWASSSVNGMALAGPLVYLLLCERALEEKNELLCKGCLYGLLQQGNLSFSELDEILRQAPDFEATLSLSHKVEIASFLHEIAHLLILSGDNSIINSRQSLTQRLGELPAERPDLLGEWSRLHNYHDKKAESQDLINFLLTEPVLNELTCDMYSLTSFCKSIYEGVVQERLETTRETVFSIGMYFAILDIQETCRRTFSERKWVLSTDTAHSRAERWIRHQVVFEYLFTETIDGLKRHCKSKEEFRRRFSEFSSCYDETLELIAMARFTLLETVSELEYPRFRAFLRAMGKNEEVAKIDYLRELQEKTGWAL